MFQPYTDWAIIAVFIIIYVLIAGRLRTTWISDAMVFLFTGLLLGPFGLGILRFNVTSENLRTITEITLALILFTDAANANLRVLKNSLRLPWRLLALGLPLTILLGFGASILLFPRFSTVEAGLLAVTLAPTDAALGKGVVTNPQVPDNIREDLNMESGLNDGICVPLLFTLLAIATEQNADNSIITLLGTLFVKQIGIGLLVGATFSVVGTQLRKYCIQKGWIDREWQSILVIALAVGCFATAQHLGGSGFISCFIGGLVFGSIVKQEKEVLLIVAEGFGNALSLITWLAFGSAVVGLALSQLTWQAVFYAILSLTLIRMLPIFLAVLGIKLALWTKLFVGWFGPRGLASIVFAVFVLDEKLPHSQEIAIIVAVTILFSVLAHGLTANPLANRYGNWIAQQKNSDY
jgi:NhaP-type Na+/H+ or K+/H+ antiporter